MTELTRAQREFRAAMANLSAAVNVLTTDGPHGRAGMTVSTACSVTDSPPTMLVSVIGRIVADRAHGSHSVLFVEVDKVAAGEDSGALVYFQRQFHNLAAS
jgi:flavin reductase (NADH)